MKKQQYLVQPNGNGKVKFLLYVLDGKTITGEWGLIGGISQGTINDYEPINAGKANELTAEQAAEADFYRTIKRKIKEGYVPTDSLENLPEMSNSEAIDLNNIPTSFCCSKPTQKIAPRTIDRLIKSGHAKFFVKYNGACHYLSVQPDGKIRVFTRRWDDHTSKYPKIVEALKNSKIPPGTLMICELCIDPLLTLDHMRAQKHMGEICKVATTKGVCKPDQSGCFKRQERYPVKAAVFGYLYYGNEKVWHQPYGKILEALKRDIKPLSNDDLLFLPQEALISSGDMAVTLAKKHKQKIEGFVLWDTRESMEVTMNGKPLRRASWKIKAKGEMDVIACGGEPGKKADRFGSLRIGRYNAKGDFISMGTVGGLKAKETDPGYWNFPCVIEVTYDNIFPDTGYLQFGSFSKIHEDKLPEEVDLFSLD